MNILDTQRPSTLGHPNRCEKCEQERHQCICDLAASWEDSGCCGMCDGTGQIDAYEDDPNWYQPGEMKPCPQCGGAGV